MISFTYMGILAFAAFNFHKAQPQGLGLWVFYVDHFLLYGHCVVYSVAYNVYTFWRKSYILDQNNQENIIRGEFKQKVEKMLLNEIASKFIIKKKI